MDNSTDTRATSHKANLLANFIAKHHGRVKGRRGPLILSMQGPQGAGKSTLAAALVACLATTFKLKAAVASLDGTEDVSPDFYLDRQRLDELAKANPSNQMLQGRGPPGTHDAELLKTTLEQIKRPEPNQSSLVSLPIFDKSLFGGRGDRSQSTIPVDPSELDVFMLEGWSLGFQSLNEDRLQQAWKAGNIARKHNWESILDINNNLSRLNEGLKDYFDCHIAITPLDLNYVYKWRLEQEHHMKRENGGIGMSDEEVRLFIDRYMPCYELYGKQTPIIDSLRLVYGSEREVVETEADGV